MLNAKGWEEEEVLREDEFTEMPPNNCKQTTFSRFHFESNLYESFLARQDHF